jgi:hypothetical protein
LEIQTRVSLASFSDALWIDRERIERQLEALGMPHTVDAIVSHNIFSGMQRDLDLENHRLFNP